MARVAEAGLHAAAHRARDVVARDGRVAVVQDARDGAGLLARRCARGGRRRRRARGRSGPRWAPSAASRFTSGSMSGSVAVSTASAGRALFTVGVFSHAGSACSPAEASGAAAPRPGARPRPPRPPRVPRRRRRHAARAAAASRTAPPATASMTAACGRLSEQGVVGASTVAGRFPRADGNFLAPEEILLWRRSLPLHAGPQPAADARGESPGRFQEARALRAAVVVCASACRCAACDTTSRRVPRRRRRRRAGARQGDSDRGAQGGREGRGHQTVPHGLGGARPRRPPSAAARAARAPRRWVAAPLRGRRAAASIPVAAPEAAEADSGPRPRTLDPNARYATTYRPGGAALAAFDAAVARGQIPAQLQGPRRRLRRALRARPRAAHRRRPRRLRRHASAPPSAPTAAR